MCGVSTLKAEGIASAKALECSRMQGGCGDGKECQGPEVTRVSLAGHCKDLGFYTECVGNPLQ